MKKKYIDRDILISCCENHKSHTIDANDIMRLPAAAVIPVVRCKDCVRNNRFDCPLCYIEKQTLTFINHDPEFYCGCGEKGEV